MEEMFGSETLEERVGVIQIDIQAPADQLLEVIQETQDKVWELLGQIEKIQSEVEGATVKVWFHP